MEIRLSKFSQLYRTATKHWYLFPRAQYFSKDHLKEFHAVLTLLQTEQYIKVKDLPIVQKELFETLDPEDLLLRDWTTDTQQKVQDQMIERGIIKPRAKDKQSQADHLANIRNHINLFKKLGFAYFNKQKHLFISPSGEKFLSADKRNWPELVENQLVKLQFCNPSLDNDDIKKYRDFKIFPYLFTLKLILSLTKKTISTSEFTLFVTPTMNDSNIHNVVRMIEDFRSLPEKARDKVIKNTKITRPHLTNSAVTLGLFGCTPTVTFKRTNWSCGKSNEPNGLLITCTQR